MKYIWPITIIILIYFSFDFANQNSEIIKIKYSLNLINYHFAIEKPIYLVIFLAFTFGIILSILYFLIYHSKLKLEIRNLKLKIDKLKKSIDKN